MTLERAQAPGNRSRIRRWANDPIVRRAIVITLVARLVLGVFGWAALAIQPAHRVNGVERLVAHDHVLSAIAGPWEHFDAIIYQRIALRGYPHGGNDTAFYPLYPLILKPVAVALGGGLAGYAIGALLVSTIAMVFALIVLQRVVALDLGDDAARWTAFLIALYPLAFAFLAGYTESLFLLLAAGAFLAIRRKHFVWAGLLAAGATLCRSQGIALEGVLLVAFIADAMGRRAEGRLPVRWSYAILTAPPAALVGFSVWASHVVGVTPLQAENRGFGLVTVAPWKSIVDAIRFAVHGHGLGTGWLNVGATLGLVVLTVLMIGRVPWDYPVYCALSAIPILFRETLGFATEGPLKGTDRYVLVIFPLFAFVAAATKRWPALRWVIAVVSGLLLLRTFWFFAHADYVS